MEESNGSGPYAHFKDAILDSLARHGNVAQFVSYAPDLRQRFARVLGLTANYRFACLEEAVGRLLERSVEHSVNVRSFDPSSPKSKEFIYGLRNKETVASTVQRLASQGLFTIVNETIDVDDGGVSGVALGDVIELAPGDTPRAVEKPGILQMPRALAERLLEIVYGFRAQLRYPLSRRVEFSIHPLRRGFRNEHTVIWEIEQIGRVHLQASLHWPNRFSRHIGDKAFGLLIAELAGLPVPHTIVIGRRVPPFSFGRETSSNETWIRTCPVEQVPGKFTSRRGWIDPFKLMNDEDPSGTEIASILAQAGVDARYSGALIATQDIDGSTKLTIEGISGFGDEFMVGKKAPERLPKRVLREVESLYRDAESFLGPVRFEWVADGKMAWVVQLHRGATVSNGSVVYPGTPDEYLHFDIRRGLEELRHLIGRVGDTNKGIALVGEIGITSHFGDVLRRAKIPSRICSAQSNASITSQ